MLSTGSVSAVEQTSEGIRDIMDYAHAGVIKRKLDDVYRTAGTTGGSRGDKAERESRTAFIVSASHNRAGLTSPIAVDC